MPSSVSRTARLPCSAASNARRAASALASALFETCFMDTVSSSTALDELTVSMKQDRKSTRLNSSHDQISYAVFCLKKKTNTDVIAWGHQRKQGIACIKLLDN